MESAVLFWEGSESEKASTPQEVTPETSERWHLEENAGDLGSFSKYYTISSLILDKYDGRLSSGVEHWTLTQMSGVRIPKWVKLSG